MIRLRLLASIPAVALSALLGAPPVSGANDAEFARLLDSADAALQVESGTRYEHGEGVPRDYDRAVRLYCEAASQGSGRAQYALGWMYANGRGVARDDDLAAAWFREAAASGDRYAARMLERVRGTGPAAPARCVRPNGAEVLALPASNSPRGRRRIVRLVHRLAPDYGLDPALVLAVIQVESNFDPGARSRKNAQGLMQLIPATARRFGVRDIMHPRENLQGGMAYLQWLLGYFRGDLEMALAGYNAGEAAVRRYRGIPPYAETRRYVKMVLRLYRQSLVAAATRPGQGLG